MNLTTFLTLAHRFGPPMRADHSDKLRLWVLSKLVEKGQGYQRSQRVQDRAILRLSRGPEVLVTPVRSYSKIALFITTSTQNKDMSRGRSATRRDMIRERTKAGLAAARARGRIKGRPQGITTEAQVKVRAVKAMYALKTHTILEIG